MKRNVLLAVVGLTPQVVTETLFYLTQIRKLPVHEVRIVTTAVGRERCEKLLLSAQHGALQRFFADYGLEPAYVAPVTVLKDPVGQPLQDIRTVQDNMHAADQILRVVGDCTSDSSTRLFCSLAGGRKTMSTFAGFAMQLLARPDDELLHVLVHPPVLESRRDFFYPPPAGDFVAHLPDGSEIRIPADEIKIDCAEVPFVRLRGWFPSSINPTDHAYRHLVELTQEKLDSESVDLQIVLRSARGRPELRVTWGGKSRSFYLTPRSAAVMHFFINHAGESIRSDQIDEQYGEEIDQIYRSLYVRGTVRQYDDWGSGEFSTALTRLNSEIAKSDLPPRVAERCKIRRTRSGGFAHYCLEISPENCHVLVPDD